MSEPNIIAWTAPMLKDFKVAYAKACADKVETFEFGGNTFLPSYAKYLIEYLTGKFREQS